MQGTYWLKLCRVFVFYLSELSVWHAATKVYSPTQDVWVQELSSVHGNICVKYLQTLHNTLGGFAKG